MSTMALRGKNKGANGIVTTTTHGSRESLDVNPVNNTVVNQDYTRWDGVLQVEVTNETNATVNRYISMDGATGLTIQFEKIGGTDTVTHTVEASCEDNGTTSDSAVYQDITQYGMDIQTASATAASYTADVIHSLKAGSNYKFINIKTVSSGGANDADYAIHVKRWYN